MATFSITTGHNTTCPEDIRHLQFTYHRLKPLERNGRKLYFYKHIKLYDIYLYLFVLQGHKEYYAMELELNAKLRTFAVNCSLLYGGHNTVHAQLKFKSKRGKFSLQVGHG